jgi:hypothetical protein
MQRMHDPRVRRRNKSANKRQHQLRLFQHARGLLTVSRVYELLTQAAPRRHHIVRIPATSIYRVAGSGTLVVAGGGSAAGQAAANTSSIAAKGELIVASHCAPSAVASPGLRL